MGSAVGVAVFGAVVNSRVTLTAAGVPEGAGLANAMHLVYLAIFVVAVVLLGSVLFLPAHRREQSRSTDAAEPVAA